MHTVRNSSPVKDVAAARAASSGKNQGYDMPSDAPPGPTALIIYIDKKQRKEDSEEVSFDTVIYE